MTTTITILLYLRKSEKRRGRRGRSSYSGCYFLSFGSAAIAGNS